jgi:hypothetical protein
MKTHQETFDIVYNAILKQGCFSYDLAEGCLYRGPNGVKCAAGHLIPDDKYDPKMEGIDAHLGIVKTILVKEDYDIEFVRQLQVIHDTHAGGLLAVHFKMWKDHMIGFAEEHNLMVPGL